MEITAASVVPALATLAAAFVAGGIARSNLIVSKESKISEFRQAWVGELRENLSMLFSAIRLLARAVQEERDKQNGNGTNPKFHFSQDKIVEVRHSSAELKYRIGLLLDSKKDTHVELQRLLSLMMGAQQTYLTGGDNADITPVFDAVERANEMGTVVVAQEWETVRHGEPEYRDAVKRVDSVLLVAGILMFALAAVAFFAPATEEKKTAVSNEQVNPADQSENKKSIPIAIPRSATKLNDANGYVNISGSASHAGKTGSEIARNAPGTSAPPVPNGSPNESSAPAK
jgi:hypothetical protein